MKGATAAKSGTETISGTLKGQAAMSASPVFHLTFHGPVTTAGTFPLGNAPKEKGRPRTLKTAAGNFVIMTRTGSTTQKLLSTSTCRFEFSTTVPYTVSGGQSTGQFAGATGSGRAVVVFAGNLPKVNGKCNTSTTAAPAVSTVVSTFRAAGPLTLK
jgi:hypothetical protein